MIPVEPPAFFLSTYCACTAAAEIANSATVAANTRFMSVSCLTACQCNSRSGRRTVVGAMCVAGGTCLFGQVGSRDQATLRAESIPDPGRQSCFRVFRFRSRVALPYPGFSCAGPQAASPDRRAALYSVAEGLFQIG